jgi:hypothetical protein
VHRFRGGVHEIVEAIDQRTDAGLAAEVVVVRHEREEE